ncbi:hypothetical protein MKW98_014631 [Papaver atlanticum]|uniref:Uncharacterized protein n=1 Tax=Papaver atlanticum TaxID=357466 RepID=A0AAD4SG98_9MAGN|nr:hypothetical protein MKW98_014631 [Papaver atlanticum]
MISGGDQLRLSYLMLMFLVKRNTKLCLMFVCKETFLSYAKNQGRFCNSEEAIPVRKHLDTSRVLGLRDENS